MSVRVTYPFRNLVRHLCLFINYSQGMTFETALEIFVTHFM